MAERGQDRIRCRYCGANNFAGTASCWQCSRPLMDRGAVGAPTMIEQGGTPSSAPQSYLPNPLPVSQEASLANKAAIALGLMLPFIGLPVGIIFLMLDDPRKTQLGWLTIWWSVAGTLITIVGSFLIIGPILAIFSHLLPSSTGHNSIPDLSGGFNMVLARFM